MAQAEVTAADIARLAGVGRAAVSNWRRRFPDFPEPVGGTQSSPSFRLDEVERWLRSNSRLPGAEPLSELWLAIQHAGPLDRVVERVATFLSAADGRRLEDSRLASAVEAAVAAADAPAVFEFLLERYLDQQSRRGTAETPPAVCDLMADLVPLGGATVLDPACGAGGLLHAAAVRGARVIFGQTAEPDVAILARARLTLAGTSRSKPRDALTGSKPGRGIAGEPKAEIRDGTLREDAFPEATADVVLTRPPYAQRDWGYDELTFDPRWEYGLPPRGEPELAWVQHALARTKPGGYAIVLLPPSVAARPAGRRIRNALLRRGALRCVIALPSGAVTFTHLQLHIWVLRSPDRSAIPLDVLLVDGASLTWPDEARAIRDAVTAYLSSGKARADGVDGMARAVPLIDLLDESIDLTPARHLAARAPAASPQEVASRRADLAVHLAGLAALLPDPQDSHDLPPLGPRWTTVAELIRDGRLTLHAAADTAVRPGDVVVTTSGRPHATVIPEDNDSQESSGTDFRVLLRADPEHVDSWFLAGFVCRESNLRAITSLGSSRLDIRRARIPYLPLDRQRAYGIRFERLDAFDRAVRDVVTRSEEVTRLIAEGLARGTLSRQHDAGSTQ